MRDRLYSFVSFLSNTHTYALPFAVRSSPLRPLEQLSADITAAVEARFEVKERLSQVSDTEMEQRVANLLHLPRLQLLLHLGTMTSPDVQHIEQREAPIFKMTSPEGPAAQEQLMIRLPGFFVVSPHSIGGFPIAEFSVKAATTIISESGAQDNG